MNWAHHLSETVFGPRHVQPHQPKNYATKKKKITKSLNIDQKVYKDTLRNPRRKEGHVRKY